MLYSDLIQFEPVETVVQLREADQVSEAHRFVSTYVVSERMKEVFVDILLPHLRFDQPHDHKGLLIVGNYGSGKSHLMSVLSAIAQWPDLHTKLRSPQMAEALKPIAGRFQVLRMETSTTQMSLRDIVLKEKLEPFLRERGIEVSFPSMMEVSNTKDPLLRVLEQFEKRFPDQGLLIVVDELLDYLRTRKDQELILDLSFMRELGEVSRLGRLRFVAGIQEALFDSPRFQFAADAMRRVRDRFEQVRITREDIAYVVSERLLHKTDSQKALIREHLRRFTPYYSKMAKRLDDFVALFPVHPAYLDAFESITFAEKRVVLKAISQTIRSLMGTEVPDDSPGVISYDAYWPLLSGDPIYRTSPEIRAVVTVSKVLSDRVAHGYTRPQYRDLAERLVDALSVLRLTTGDIYAPIGATPEELCDDLALFAPNLPEQDADFLRMTVETALRELYRTMSGQFISVNPSNGQYYLDLKKTTDYDAEIEKRAESLDNEMLNRYYFEALRELLDKGETTYVTGYRIWQHEVPWAERRVMRPGYLFFGTPQERSTAQPPRDFYLYFLQPFDLSDFEDEQKSDEVFFQLTALDDDLLQAIKTYAGAMDMAVSTSGADQQTYRDKANQSKAAITKWLRTHPNDLIVTYQGTSHPLLQWERSGVGIRSDAPYREIVQGVAAGCLATHFEKEYELYPTFTALRYPITAESLPKMVQDALRAIAKQRTQSGIAILDGLSLLDGEYIRPESSPYARYVTELLEQKQPGEVLNRHELIETWMGNERVRHFKMQPEYLVVVLMALVYTGEIEVMLPGRKIDAQTLEEVTQIPVGDMVNFRYVSRPKDLPLGALIATCELLDISPELMQNPASRETGVDELQTAIGRELERVVTLRERVRKGVSLWGGQVLEGDDFESTLAHLDAYKAFLESLRPFNAPGKLRNYPHSADVVREQRPRYALLSEVTILADQIGTLQPLTAYLREAASILPENSKLAGDIQVAQEQHLAILHDSRARRQAQTIARLRQELETLKADYIEFYMELHSRSRLDAEQDRSKVRLIRDPRFKQLRVLSKQVPLLPQSKLDTWERDTGAIVSCWRLIPSDLKYEPVCPYCHFRPVRAGSTTANELLAKQVDSLDRLWHSWQETLRENLTVPTAQKSIALLTDDVRKQLESFRDGGDLPNPLDDDFLNALSQALQGLKQVVIPPEEILSALTKTGAPATIKELRERFDEVITRFVRDEDPERVRIVIEW